MAESDQSVVSLPNAGGDSASASAPQSGTSGPAKNDAILAALTDKQRAVLDLLIEHKTSKEISRILGISHHTVDQRIMLARAKLGVATRGEVAQAYRRLVNDAAANESIYERSVYNFSDVAPFAEVPQEPVREGGAAWHRPQPIRQDALPRAAYPGGEVWAEPYHHVLPEIFDGPYGTYIRLGTIAVFAMFLILVVLGGLAMYAQLSQIISN